MSPNLKCPICSKSAKQEESSFPFCSARCREIDLGEWASQKRVIKGKDGEAATLLNNDSMNEESDSKNDL